MNLKFWKKKIDTGNDAKDTQEKPADETVAQDLSNPEAPDTETTAKSGLAARMKSWFGALTGRFRRAPAFSAEGDQSTDAQDSSGNIAGDTTVINPDLKPSDQEAPEIRPVNLKKRLIVGGAIALLVLLLIGIGFAAWKFFSPPPKKETGASGTAKTSHVTRPAPQPEAPRPEASKPEVSPAEIEALKKKNEELQAQIEALKNSRKEQLRQPSARQTNENISVSPAGGEIKIGNENPKATAMSIKEAIEAMNAISGDYDKKPAKKPAK